MPVMDAFKNLIRHGKQAKAAPAQPTTTTAHTRAINAQPQVVDLGDAPTSSVKRAARRQDAPNHIDLAAVQQEPHVTQGPNGQAIAVNAPPVQTPYSKEAEMIVKEEREAADRMPNYAGLERFRLVEKMGDGAFSHVYKAVDKQTGQKVAVKVVRKYELSASQDGDKHLNPNFKKRPKVTERANILKEVQIMRGLNHPNIIKLIEFTESNEHYFLTLELMEGGELFHQIVKLTYFSEHLARHVILQVAKGIRYLHEEKGVVHRDIKPENILFERIPIIPSKEPAHRPYDEEKEDEGEFTEGLGGGGIGRIKLADFGLSKIVWDEQTMTPCGTVGYTAPEIVKDERYSKSVDMWAMGCVLYTLLCGFPPFYDESINVLTEKVARGYYTFLSPWWDDISASSKDLITHLLCVDPTQRYTIDEFLAHPWCKEPIGQIPPTPALRTPANALRAYDSPLMAPMGGRDGRSPGVATLKEAFDITYAVHRMEEEGARRNRGPVLPGLNEEPDDEDDEAVVMEASRRYGSKTGNQLADGRAGVRDRGGNRQQKPKKQGAGTPAGHGFELKMDDATLLGRRKHQRKVEPSPLGKQQPVYRQMTPMQIE